MRRAALLSLFATFALAGCQKPAPEQPPVAAWTEFAPGDRVQLRAVVAGDACPAVLIDGKARRMETRAAPDKDFPLRTCALALDGPATSAQLGGHAMPLPGPVNRIVVFGDTGCRIKGKTAQDCVNPAAWPFARVVAQATAKRPDLVIHVGDYHYRESPCPPGNRGCSGSPSGDNWDVWRADFLAPADPLLRAAPWVMVRGNHEECARAGKGWVRLIDPHPASDGCTDPSESYRVRLDGLTLLVADSAIADDAEAPAGLVAKLGADLARNEPPAPEPFWLVTHRPVWALTQEDGKKPVAINRTEEAAFDPAIPPNLDLVLSGHIHTFSAYDFRGARPAQLVVGTGGALYDQLKLPGPQVEIDGRTTKDAFNLSEYGYLVLDRTDQGWTGAFHRAGDDKVVARCTMKGRSLRCAKA